MASVDDCRCNEGDPGQVSIVQELRSGLPKIAETDARGRTIHYLEEYVSVRGCSICKKWNSSESGYVYGMTMLACDQCGREYHVSCLKESGIEDLDELPEGDWFCENDCKSIDNILTMLVATGSESLSGSYVDEFLEYRQRGVHSLENSESSRRSYEWQMLCGKAGSTDNTKTLAETLIVFTECLEPIKDIKTGQSLIPLMVHSKRSKDYDFEGIFCVVLKLNEKVVSGALLQVFGQEVAEIPVVATSLPHRRQGFCKALITTIERLLGVLEVKRLVLPTPRNTKSMWINKFDFTQMEDEQLSEICRTVPLLTFTDTCMLEKPVPPLAFRNVTTP